MHAQQASGLPRRAAGTKSVPATISASWRAGA